MVNPQKDLCPNVLLTRDILSENIILCCGEDKDTILYILHNIFNISPTKTHEYRSYAVFKYEEFSLVLSGIGTGCLEPLLYELQQFNIAKKIILIGTAGSFCKTAKDLGKSYYINSAQVYGTGLDFALANDASIHPNWAGSSSWDDTASIISTDFYYGFGESANCYYLNNVEPIRNKYLELKESGNIDFVDMEVAQFYILCSYLSKIHKLQYIAIKGAANSIKNPNEQQFNTNDVLFDSFKKAFYLLKIEISSRNFEFIPCGPEKLIAEVKLFWTVQMAIVTVLGFLFTHINQHTPWPNVYLLVICFFILTIGAVHNIISNYYTRVEGLRSNLSTTQEGIMTPVIASFYTLISPIIGIYAGKNVSDLFSINNFFTIIIQITVATVFYMITLKSQNAVYNQLSSVGPAGYKSYATNLGSVVTNWFGPLRFFKKLITTKNNQLNML